ncbi:hypothetical protein NMH_0008 [Neisseria meningitidis H44/76]|uniref:Uncharacterized protein n=1 Tax=Neisseria meningitidis serogroup B / serotype 15 (strain H44/76) TaxID=909420 RepID=E6MV03_NEIMH|nr:hypothetical protein NMH_0008 [Neisseria meningitidis H44/76]
MKMPSEAVLRFQTAFCHLESRCCHTQAVHKEQPYHAPHIDCHCRRLYIILFIFSQSY